jgi:hypothetical protein
MKKLLFTFLFLLQINAIKTMDVGLCAGQEMQYEDVITNLHSNELTIDNGDSFDENKPSVLKKTLTNMLAITFVAGWMFCVFHLFQACFSLFKENIVGYYRHYQLSKLPSSLKDNIYGNIYNQHFIPEE